jgi:ubiquinone/menaquinone biosynthesis C-methylase UbiE
LRKADWEILFQRTCDYYRSDAEEYKKRWDVDKSLKKERRMFLNALAPNSDLLDVGCGPGHHARFFAEQDQGHNVVGIDVCKEFVEIAEKKAVEEEVEGIRFEVGDMRDLSEFERNKFDGVWACAVCVHTPREFLDSQLNEFLAVLKPGGVLGISFRLGDPAGQQDDGRYFEHHEEAEILARLQQVGFRVAQTRTALNRKSTNERDKLKQWLFVLAIAPNPKESILAASKPVDPIVT